MHFVLAVVHWGCTLTFVISYLLLATDFLKSSGFIPANQRENWAPLMPEWWEGNRSITTLFMWKKITKFIKKFPLMATVSSIHRLSQKAYVNNATFFLGMQKISGFVCLHTAGCWLKAPIKSKTMFCMSDWHSELNCHPKTRDAVKYVKQFRDPTSSAYTKTALISWVPSAASFMVGGSIKVMSTGQLQAALL